MQALKERLFGVIDKDRDDLLNKARNRVRKLTLARRR